MFYALAHLEKQFFADSLLKFVAIAPCNVSKQLNAKMSPAQMLQNLYDYHKIGVYTFGGQSERW